MNLTRPLPRVRATLVAAACLAAPLAATAAPAQASALPGARSFNGQSTVGALFPSGTSRAHSCVGTVILSPTRNLVVTAAHCIAGYGTNMVFVPGYAAGRMPHGSWRVRRAHVDDAWRLHHDARHDVAVLEMSPQAGTGRNIQNVTGGVALGVQPRWNALTTVPAYRSGRNDLPVRCTTRVGYASGYPEFACRGYPNGVSGSPFIVGRTITGVIGGLHQGGCTPSVSFSSPFTARMVNHLVRLGTQHASQAWIPAAGSAGC